MHVVGNSLNGRYPADLVHLADTDALVQIDLAVAYVTKMDSIFELAKRRAVPLNLYALADGDGFPHLDVTRRFVESRRTTWRLFLTRGYYHPKVIWFRGVGALIGSANLTDAAWFQNLECGVWVPEDDLNRLNWNDELSAMFRVVQGRCREATMEDLGILEQLRDRRAELNAAERKFKEDVNRLLGRLPGARPPVDFTRRNDPGGAARAAFLVEWNEGLTILRKITRLFDDRREEWPEWAERDVAPAIAQDQATEAFWEADFRRSGESAKAMVDAHERNRHDPDAAVLDVLRRWSAMNGSADAKKWSQWVNQNPKELHELLTPEALRAGGEDQLARVLHLCHSAREHGRQIRKADLGLGEGDERSAEERSRLFARYLMARRSAAKGRTIFEVLEFVLWGDQIGGRSAPDAAERIWLAAHDDAWKLPHLGPHILGELIGYARPEKYPPRNNRVSKTLYALGYDVNHQ